MPMTDSIMFDCLKQIAIGAYGANGKNYDLSLMIHMDPYKEL